MYYQKQGTDFLTKTKTKMKVEFVEHDFYFDDDKEARDIYRITLTRNGKRYSFKFGQSIANTGTEPTAYDVLACLTKYDPYSFENFCADFGYDLDSRKAEKTFKMVQKEFENVQRLFGDVIEKLQEIQ
jgi:hypothetical protein